MLLILLFYNVVDNVVDTVADNVVDVVAAAAPMFVVIEPSSATRTGSSWRASSECYLARWCTCETWQAFIPSEHALGFWWLDMSWSLLRQHFDEALVIQLHNNLYIYIDTYIRYSAASADGMVCCLGCRISSANHTFGQYKVITPFQALPTHPTIQFNHMLQNPFISSWEWLGWPSGARHL